MHSSPTRATAAIVRTCFIHIGTPKTGSTSLQAFLAENRVTFKAAGIFIPESAGTGDSKSSCHHAVASELLGEPEVRTGGLRTVLAELAASDSPHSCISSENISLLYDRPELLTRLRDGIHSAGFTPVIIAFVRPQVSYGTAVFGLNTLYGYREPFSSYVAHLLQSGGYTWKAGYGPQFDYVTLLDGFAAIFGHANVVVKAFSSDAPDSALHRAFVKTLLPNTRFESFTIPPKRANRTMTFAALLKTLGVSNDFDQHLRFAPFRLGDIARFWHRFAPANRRLKERYGLRLPVFEIHDVVRALPIRRTLALTFQLAKARRALRDFK